MVCNLMMGEPYLYEGDDLVVKAATAIEKSLREALSERGSASLIVSGGSSPKPVYERLSQVDLDWSNVTISLVDERWVDPGQVGSNQDFISQTLLQNKASAAKFFGLKTADDTVEEGLAKAEQRFNAVHQPFDICVMGMGTDGHTASWFPHSLGLNEAMTSNSILCAIDATGCEVAGDHPSRISLTLKAVLDARTVILFIPGEAKRRVLDAAPDKLFYEAPVQALLMAGSKLQIYASPIS